MIGVRIGTRFGTRFGTAIGPGVDPLGGAPIIPGVTQDALSGKYVPASAAEWTLLMAAAGLATGNPSAGYGFQDASGNPTDFIGAFPLTASGTGLSYANAVAGWTRKAINTTVAGTGLLQSTDAALPNISTTSMLLLGYAKPTTNASTRDIWGGGAAATRIILQTLTTTGIARVSCAANTASGAADSGGVVRPWVVGINRTNSSAAGYTDADKMVPTFGATAAGQSISVGSFVGGGAACQYLYLVAFFGAAAELTSAQVKTLLTTLGWSIPWS